MRPPYVLPSLVLIAGLAGCAPFFDDFTSLSLHRTWQAGDKWQLIAPDTPDGRGGPANNEAGDQYWVNPFNPNTPIQGIYQIGPSGLQLGLLPTPAAVAAYIDAQAGATMKYVGGMLNTSQTCYQRYGYWEVVASVPKIPGVSFQFDLENVQLTGQWPPEVDVRIATGQSGSQSILMQVATSLTTNDAFTSTAYDFTKQHTYGVSWQADFIEFFIDGTMMHSLPTPTTGAYTTSPMFLFMLSGANYVGNWDPPASALPAHVNVASVTVWQAKPGGTPTPTSNPATPTPAPTPTPTTPRRSYSGIHPIWSLARALSH